MASVFGVAEKEMLYTVDELISDGFIKGRIDFVDKVSADPVKVLTTRSWLLKLPIHGQRLSRIRSELDRRSLVVPLLHFFACACKCLDLL